MFAFYLHLPRYRFPFHLEHRSLAEYSMILGRASDEVAYSSHHSHDYHSIATVYCGGTIIKLPMFFVCKNRRRKEGCVNKMNK